MIRCWPEQAGTFDCQPLTLIFSLSEQSQARISAYLQTSSFRPSSTWQRSYTHEFRSSFWSPEVFCFKHSCDMTNILLKFGKQRKSSFFCMSSSLLTICVYNYISFSFIHILTVLIVESQDHDSQAHLKWGSRNVQQLAALPLDQSFWIEAFVICRGRLIGATIGRAGGVLYNPRLDKQLRVACLKVSLKLHHACLCEQDRERLERQEQRDEWHSDNLKFTRHLTYTTMSDGK